MIEQKLLITQKEAETLAHDRKMQLEQNLKIADQVMKTANMLVASVEEVLHPVKILPASQQQISKGASSTVI